MFRTRHSRVQLVIALAALCATMGCSSLPTAPETGREPDTAARSEGDGAPSAVLTQSASSTRQINGLVGGIVSAGKFKVVIPPLAIRGTATVTVTQPDLSKPVVQLGIAPESANRFFLPVLLVADQSSTDIRTLSASYISWFNPSTGKWQPVPASSVDLKLMTVQAPLFHFSTYRVESKAGW